MKIPALVPTETEGAEQIPPRLKMLSLAARRERKVGSASATALALASASASATGAARPATAKRARARVENFIFKESDSINSEKIEKKERDDWIVV